MSSRTFKLKTPHMEGSDILAWQLWLHDQFRAWDINYPLTIDGDYGQETRAATERMCEALGLVSPYGMEQGVTPELRVKLRNRRLTPSERLRFTTSRVNYRRALRKRYAAPKLTLQERAYREAKALIGVMEQGGNNRGPQVEQIIREGGGRVGDAWCGWFMATVYKRAGSKSVTWHWGAVRLWLPLAGLKRVSKPKRGDAVRFTFDHVGMFVADHGASIETIEGNTGRIGAVSDSATGGDGVYRKLRPKSQVRDYIRITR